MKKEMAPKRCPTEVEEKNEETRFFPQEARIVLASCATTSQEISSNLASKGVASQSWSTVLIFAKLFENWQ
jgi:hypothetical protein